MGNPHTLFTYPGGFCVRTTCALERRRTRRRGRHRPAGEGGHVAADLNANLDLALDTAAPIDLAIGANANIAAPINAAVDANVLSVGSTSGADAQQAAEVHQGVVGDATATSSQGSTIAQGSPAPADTPTADPAATSTTTGSPTDGNLLNVNVDLNGQLHLASPIDGSVAANANVAAPINAGVGDNIGSVDSQSVAIAHRSALIDQHIEGDATAPGNQSSAITQQSAP